MYLVQAHTGPSGLMVHVCVGCCTLCLAPVACHGTYMSCPHVPCVSVSYSLCYCLLVGPTGMLCPFMGPWALGHGMLVHLLVGVWHLEFVLYIFSHLSVAHIHA